MGLDWIGSDQSSSSSSSSSGEGEGATATQDTDAACGKCKAERDGGGGQKTLTIFMWPAHLFSPGACPEAEETVSDRLPQQSSGSTAAK